MCELSCERRRNPRRIVIIVVRLERGRRRYESDIGGHEAGRWRDENSGMPRRSVGAMWLKLDVRGQRQTGVECPLYSDLSLKDICTLHKLDVCL